MNHRKSYVEPEVMRLGTVQSLTENANLQNADVPLGDADTAHCDRVACPPTGGVS